MASGSKTFFLRIGFVVLLLFIQQAESRRGIRIRTHSSVGSGEGLDGETETIIYGCSLGGSAALVILFIILYKCGAFKCCCTQNVSGGTENDAAHMENPSTGPDGTQMQQVSTINTAGKDGYYAPPTNYDTQYSPPPQASY